MKTKRNRVRTPVTSALLLLSLLLSTTLITNITSWAGGVSLRSQTALLANQASYLRQYDQSISAAMANLRNAGNDYNAVADTFYNSYALMARDYKTALQSAASEYSDLVQVDPSAAKAAYLDNYDHAKSDFLAGAASARNTFISELFGTSGVQKDTFVTQIDKANKAFDQESSDIRNEIVGLGE